MSKYQKAIEYIRDANHATYGKFKTITNAINDIQELVDFYETFYEGAMKISERNLKLEAENQKQKELINTLEEWFRLGMITADTDEDLYEIIEDEEYDKSIRKGAKLITEWLDHK